MGRLLFENLGLRFRSTWRISGIVLSYRAGHHGACCPIPLPPTLRGEPIRLFGAPVLSSVTRASKPG